MSLIELTALLPEMIIAGSAVLLLLVISFHRNNTLSAALAALACLAAAASLVFIAPAAPAAVSSLVIADGYSIFYRGLAYAATFAVIAFSHGYLAAQEGEVEEFYVLLLLASLGLAVLAMSAHFVSLFLGLEILSVSLYTLISYSWRRRASVEAGIKYVILAGSSSAFLLFGMALLYAETGAMDFASVALALRGGAGTAAVAASIALMTVGIGFKLALVPFHMWTPDVYEGAPSPAAAFVATVSKAGVFALLFRFYTLLDARGIRAVVIAFALISAASMFAGNLLALLQRNVKRVLAYSSISHLGYLLVALIAGGPMSAEAAAFYVAAYVITMLGAFGAVTLLSPADRDADSLEDYRGLLWRRPFTAAAFAVMLLSLAGIPLTAGFIGKFYVIAAGIHAGAWVLVALLAVNSVIGLYYYLRIIVVMYSRGEDSPEAPPPGVTSPSYAGSVVLAVLAGLALWFGVQPGRLIDLIILLISPR